MKTRSNHIILLALPALLAIAVSGGCKGDNKDTDHAMAAQLFGKSASLISLYTDSIRNAKDSAALKRMANDFDERLAKINFQFPADTDLHLTEQENDSLIKLLDTLVAVRKDREKFLDVELRRDSVAQDSVNVKVAGNVQSVSTSISQSAQLK